MAEFFAMSGYGVYVWSSYALGFIVLVGNVWAARSELRNEITRTQRRTAIQKETRT